MITRRSRVAITLIVNATNILATSYTRIDHNGGRRRQLKHDASTYGFKRTTDAIGSGNVDSIQDISIIFGNEQGDITASFVIDDDEPHHDEALLECADDCKDNTDFVSMMGLPCTAHTYFECPLFVQVGFTQQQVDELIANCPCSCHACPTMAPTKAPSKSPTTSQSTASPISSTPTKSPSDEPTTTSPSALPSLAPISSSPTKAPSDTPSTLSPSEVPSFQPSTIPSSHPSIRPSSHPSRPPTGAPATTSPSLSPTSQSPSHHPSTGDADSNTPSAESSVPPVGGQAMAIQEASYEEPLAKIKARINMPQTSTDPSDEEGGEDGSLSMKQIIILSSGGTCLVVLVSLSAFAASRNRVAEEMEKEKQALPQGRPHNAGKSSASTIATNDASPVVEYYTYINKAKKNNRAVTNFATGKKAWDTRKEFMEKKNEKLSDDGEEEQEGNLESKSDDAPDDRTEDRSAVSIDDSYEDHGGTWNTEGALASLSRIKNMVTGDRSLFDV